MLPVVLLVGLDQVQAEACRSALADRSRVIAVLEAEDAVTLLSLHRPKLVVMRTDLHLHQRTVLASLAAKIGARIASVGEDASPCSVEHVVEGHAMLAFPRAEPPPPKSSGTRSRVAPGEYHLAAPRTPFVSSKAKR